MEKISRSLTKSIGINRPVSVVFDFLKNPMNWPEWAIMSVLDIQPIGDDGWFQMTTPQGSGRLRVRANNEYFLLDHDFNTS